MKRKIARWIDWILPYLVKGTLYTILKTCRITIIGAKQFQEAGSKGRCILMLWHNRLAPAAHLLARIAPHFTYGAVVSNSRDGELLAKIVNAYPQGRTIRVVHNAKHHALREVIQQLNESNTVIVMTPDGPRGPRYKIKPGIIAAARASNSSIVPLTWSASHFWQLKTWDKFMIPKPFSRIVVMFGPAQEIADDLVETIGGVSKKLEKAMSTLDKLVYEKVDTR